MVVARRTRLEDLPNELLIEIFHRFEATDSLRRVFQSERAFERSSAIVAQPSSQSLVDFDAARPSSVRRSSLHARRARRRELFSSNVSKTSSIDFNFLDERSNRSDVGERRRFRNAFGHFASMFLQHVQSAREDLRQRFSQFNVVPFDQRLLAVARTSTFVLAPVAVDALRSHFVT